MLRDPQAVSIRMRLIAGTAMGLALLALVPVQLVARRSPPPVASVERDRPAGLALAAPPVETTPAGARQEPRTARSLEGEAQGKRGAEPDLQYVFFRGDDESTMMSGSMADIERARRFRKPGERLLWFRLEGKEHRADAALLRQIEEIWRRCRARQRAGKTGRPAG
jgi:hypothetical protein